MVCQARGVPNSYAHAYLYEHADAYRDLDSHCDSDIHSNGYGIANCRGIANGHWYPNRNGVTRTITQPLSNIGDLPSLAPLDHEAGGASPLSWESNQPSHVKGMQEATRRAGEWLL